MASIVWSDVESFAPTMSTVDAAAQTDILAYVNGALNLANVGAEGSLHVRMARIYLAAHFGAMLSQGTSGASGPVTSESAGELSRTYAAFQNTSTSLDQSLDSTPYGRMYRFIVRGTAARAPVVL